MVIDLLISKTLILHFIISYCYHALLSILDRSPDVKVITENAESDFILHLFSISNRAILLLNISHWALE